MLASPASAATFTVNTTKDGVDANTADNVCATPNNTCTVRAAIDQANASSGTDQIDVPAGTFELKRPRDATPSNAGGDLYITEAVTITGAGQGETTIEQTVRDRVLFASGGSFPFGDPVKLLDPSITGGNVRAAGNQFGGGLRNDGWLALEGVAVRGNVVDPRPVAGNSGGAGIVNFGGLLSLESSSVSRNRVEVESETGSATGGGIRSDDGLFALVDSRVSRNAAVIVGPAGPARSAGGGIYLDGPGQIEGSTIAGNRADEGGGIDFGALDGELEVDSSTISGNAARRGGGLHIGADTEIPVINSTISGNTARAGSSVYLRLGAVDLRHVTVAGNRARAGHGAIEVDDLFSPPVVEVTAGASVVANKGLECAGLTTAVTSAGYNVFGESGCTAPATADVTGSPSLAPLAENPGPVPGPVTKTHALNAGSLAIDRVTAGCPPPAVDQRSLGRPQGPACDSGAYERGAG